MATDIAKFLSKLRIDSGKSFGNIAEDFNLSAIENGRRTISEEMKEHLFDKCGLSEKQKLAFARLVAESRKKVEIGINIQQDILPKYVNTTIMFDVF